MFIINYLLIESIWLEDGRRMKIFDMHGIRIKRNDMLKLLPFLGQCKTANEKVRVSVGEIVKCLKTQNLYKFPPYKGLDWNVSCTKISLETSLTKMPFPMDISCAHFLMCLLLRSLQRSWYLELGTKCDWLAPFIVCVPHL